MAKVNRTVIKNFFDDEVDDRDKSELLIDNLVMLKEMEVREYTFYKKWYEIQELTQLYNDAKNIKGKIWLPTDILDEKLTIEEIENLKPKIFVVDGDSSYRKNWELLRIFGHTMEFDINPGRFVRLLIIDENTNKYLGVLSVGSDVTAISVRDNYIGWTKDNRFVDKKLNNSSIGTCIMALQPLGYNFLGGKLVASLLTTDSIRNDWKQNYNEILVGMTTTSLYGSASMYNNIPWWKKLGSTTGKIMIKPDEKIYKEWLDWVREEKREIYDKMTRNEDGSVATSPKQNLLNYMYKTAAINIKREELFHGFRRGVYYSLFYENGREFFRGDIKEEELILKEKFNNSYDKILDWWKPKAINRYKKLKNENRLKPEIHFYDDLMGMDWEMAKEKYLGEVGR